MALAPRTSFALVAALAAITCRPADESATPEAAASPVGVDRASLEATERMLVSPELGGRGSWQPGGRRAGDWIAGRLRAMGATAAYPGGFAQPFAVRMDSLRPYYVVPEAEVLTKHRVCYYPAIAAATGDWQARNMVAVFPGQDPDAREAVVLSAHYDHQGEHQVGGEHVVCFGANDNASGAAVVLSVAEALARRTTKPRRTIVVALFDAEEEGRRGATALLEDRPPALRDKELLAINLDQMGSLRESALYFNDDSLSPSVHRTIRAVMARHPQVVPHYEELGISSDDRNFHDVGVPAIQMTSGHYRRYHTAGDGLDAISFDGLHAIADVTLDLVVAAADGAGGWTQAPPGPAVAAAVAGWERADADLHDARATICGELGVVDEGEVRQSGLVELALGLTAVPPALHDALDLFSRANEWPFGAYDERDDALAIIERALDAAMAERAPSPEVRDLHERFRASARAWRERLAVVRRTQAALGAAAP